MAETISFVKAWGSYGTGAGQLVNEPDARPRSRAAGVHHPRRVGGIGGGRHHSVVQLPGAGGDPAGQIHATCLGGNEDAEAITELEAVVDDLRETVARKKTQSHRINVAVFKELTGLTRKYAIPLLEYLDRERVTRREGDERIIL